MTNDETDILYQWPKSIDAESIYPRCVVIHKLYLLADRDLRTVDVSFPSKQQNFDKELKARLKNLPQVHTQEKVYDSTSQIVNYLLKNCTTKKCIKYLEKLNSAYNVPLSQWANEVFLNSLIYSRWKIEDNYQVFIRSVDWGKPFEEVQESANELRSGALTYLSRFPINEFREVEFQEYLKVQFWSLERIIADNKYFDQMFLTVTDLYVYMVIQGFMSDTLKESIKLKKDYPELNRWYEDLTKELASI